MDFRILGVLEVADGGHVLDLQGAKLRAVLAMLCLNVGEAISADRLTEALWGDAAPPSASNTLQTYVSKLRRALGPGIIQTRTPG